MTGHGARCASTTCRRRRDQPALLPSQPGEGRLLIGALTLIVEKTAGGLASANVSLLNGADGLSEVVAGLVGQGLAIFDSLRSNVGADKNPQTPDRSGGGPPRGKRRPDPIAFG
jgi:hypothetical protein